MRPLTGELLVEAWDKGSGEDALMRPLALLRCAGVDGDLESLPLPERDQALLRLRQISFGDVLAGYLPCPSCGARLEFSMPLDPVLEQREAAYASVRARGLLAAKTTDLAAALAEREPAAARRVLAERCAASPEALDELHAAFEIQAAVRCPVCNELQHVDLDIARFLWSEVRRAALGLLRDVHELAAAYGWSEAAILAMSPARRSAYLEMANA